MSGVTLVCHTTAYSKAGRSCPRRDNAVDKLQTGVAHKLPNLKGR